MPGKRAKKFAGRGCVRLINDFYLPTVPCTRRIISMKCVALPRSCDVGPSNVEIDAGVSPDVIDGVQMPPLTNHAD